MLSTTCSFERSRYHLRVYKAMLEQETINNASYTTLRGCSNLTPAKSMMFHALDEGLAAEFLRYQCCASSLLWLGRRVKFSSEFDQGSKASYQELQRIEENNARDA